MEWRQSSVLDFFRLRLHSLQHRHCESQLKEESEWRAALRVWGGGLEFKERGLDVKWCGTLERRSGREEEEGCEEVKNVAEAALWEGRACLEVSGGGGAEVGWGRAPSSLWLCEWGECGEWAALTVCSWVCECEGSVWVSEGAARGSAEAAGCVCTLQWEFRWRRSTAVRVKPFPQVSHTYGRSPVCERTCRWRSPDPAKHLPKNRQGRNGTRLHSRSVSRNSTALMYKIVLKSNMNELSLYMQTIIIIWWVTSKKQADVDGYLTYLSVAFFLAIMTVICTIWVSSTACSSVSY